MKKLNKFFKEFLPYAIRWQLGNGFGIPAAWFVFTYLGLNAFWGMVVFSALGAIVMYFPDKWLFSKDSRPQWLQNFLKGIEFASHPFREISDFKCFPKYNFWYLKLYFYICFTLGTIRRFYIHNLSLYQWYCKKKLEPFMNEYSLIEFNSAALNDYSHGFTLPSEAWALFRQEFNETNIMLIV